MYTQLNENRIGWKSKVKRFKDPLDGQDNQLWPKINEKKIILTMICQSAALILFKLHSKFPILNRCLMCPIIQEKINDKTISFVETR